VALDEARRSRSQQVVDYLEARSSEAAVQVRGSEHWLQ
jgi:hypothetical protein